MWDFINSHLGLIIFIYYDDDYYYFLMVIINIIITNFKHVKSYKFWICHLDVTIILDFKCWNTFRCNGSWDTIKERNKASKQLICSCNKNIVKRDFTNIMNLFHAYVWLNEAIKLLIENHETCPIGYAPFSEVNAAINIMNLFHAFVWLNKAMSFW